MKHTDTELEEILNQLIASTRSPRGRFSAAASYPELEKRLKSHTRHLTLIRTFSAAAAVALLCLSVWTAYLYMQPAAIQTISTLAETRTVRLPDGSSVMLNHYSSLSYPEKFQSDIYQAHEYQTSSGQIYVPERKLHLLIGRGTLGKLRLRYGTPVIRNE